MLMMLHAVVTNAVTVAEPAKPAKELRSENARLLYIIAGLAGKRNPRSEPRNIAALPIILSR